MEAAARGGLLRKGLWARLLLFPDGPNFASAVEGASRVGVWVGHLPSVSLKRAEGCCPMPASWAGLLFCGHFRIGAS